MQDSASEVQGEVASGAMPRGSTLAPADKSALLAWLGAGAQCSGTPPPQPDGGIIEGPPVLAGEVVVLPQP